MAHFRTSALCLLVAGTLAAQTWPADQAASGRTAYLGNCASCHLPNLSGRNEAPQLSGGNFMSVWSTRTAGDLATYMQETMPPSNPGGLGQETYQALAAFILQANGAAPGSAGATTRINTVASGQMPAPMLASLNDASTDQASLSTQPRPTGHSVRGTVKNFVPVTDAMLTNPDPADWLMIRRNYQAWSYSPLTQITADNVKNLRLKWVWSMNDGGASQPTPLVHDGIIFLSNTSNTVQALDGRTGDLIWENHIGPDALRAYGATRSLAIYGDKVFLSTTDAKLVALDARTGKVVWTSEVADSKKGYASSSGAITIRRQSSPGPHWLHAIPRRRLLHQRLGRRDR